MGFTDEYLELRKKKKKKETTGHSFTDEYNNLRAQAQETAADNIAPVLFTQAMRDTEASLAEMIKEEEELRRQLEEQKKEAGGLEIFQKGAFEDGYQFGDVVKSILGTTGDAGLGVVKGIAGLGEGLGDLINYGIAGAADAIGKDDFARKVRRRTQENTIEDLTSGADEFLDKYSVLGRTSDSVMQGVGQVGAILATGGLGSAAGLSSAGATALTTGTMGLSSMGSGMSEAYKGGATDGEAVAYGAMAGAADAITELIFGGLGKGINALGFSKGLSSADDILAKTVSSKIKGTLGKNLVEFGIKSSAEGLEEVLAGVAQAAAKKATYMSEEDFADIVKDENLLEQFIVGAFTSGIAQAPGLHTANKTGTDFVTGQTQNEQAVVKKEIENRIAELGKDGKKLTAKEKSAIKSQVEKDLDKGYISTDTIEEVLGGESYQKYKDTIDSENALLEQQKALQEEFDTLNKMKQGEMTGEQIDRRAELKEELSKLKDKIQSTQNDSPKNDLKQQLSDLVSKMVKGDRLIESYNERSRRGQAFEADLTKYDTKQQTVIQKAIDSGILNNTNRTHEFVDMVAKISADKGVLFDFTNNEKLKDSGFAVDGKTVNGYVTKDGVTLNIQSAKSLNSVVGHEITHVLEGTELYTELQNVLVEYAKSKGDYQGRYDSLAELYKDVKDANIDAELTADLVGDYLFTDPDFIVNLSTNHRNVFQKIYDEIKYLLKVATAGSKEDRELEKVKKAFEDAYRADGKVTDTKYSLSDSEVMEQSINNLRSEIETVNDGLMFAEGDEYRTLSNKLVKLNHELDKLLAQERQATKKTPLKTVIDNLSQYRRSDLESLAEQVSEGAWDGYEDLSRAELEDSIREMIEEKGYSPIEMQNSKYGLWVRPVESAKYSLTDSTGKELTKEQQEYFKDSKMRDENGNLKVMYHGSQDAGFHVFDAKMSDDDTSFFFVDRNDVAASYSGTTETYEAKAFRTVEDANSFFAEIGKDEYEVVEKDGKYTLLDDGDEVATSDDLSRIYDEFRDWEGVGYGDANYKVYLNLKNPLVVDGKGRPWNKIDAEFSQEVYDKYQSLTAEEKEALTDLAEWEDFSLFNREIQEAKGNELASAYAKMGEDVNIYDLFSVAADNFSEESLRENSRYYLKTRDFAQRAKEQGYDGVIFNNIVDNGGYSNGDEGASTVAIAFDSNQIKSVANEKPTADPDIRYSLTEYTEEEKKAHNKAVLDHFGKTYRWAETGYILLDGSKLDLSGKHEGAPGGYRTVDHRDIVDALGSDYGDDTYSGSLVQFMSEGNIRISPESDGINLSVKPNKAQEAALTSFIQNAHGEVILDIDDANGYTVVSVEYPSGTSAFKVLNDIRGWFDNGKKPEVSNLSQFRYSLSKQSEYAPTFYSQMARVVDDTRQQKLGAASVVNMLRGKGIKAEEIKWSGIEEWLEGKKSVTKEELQEFIKGSQLQIEETVLEDGDGTISYTEDEQHDLQVMSDWLSRRMDQAKELWQEAYGEEIPLNVLFADDTASAITREIIDRNGGIRGFRGVDGMSEAERTLYSEVTDGIRRLDLQIANIRERAESRQRNTSNTNWGQYRLDGGNNYREYLFKMPGSDYRNQAMDTHWRGERGVLAHARVQDFDSEDGKMLFIEEIQSDWHNEGAKEGYADEKSKGFTELTLGEYEMQDNGVPIAEVKDGFGNTYAYVMKHNGKYIVDLANGSRFDTFTNEDDALSLLKTNAQMDEGVPDAPFKHNYHEFVLKKLIREAAEKGYDSIGWTPASTQVDRWSPEYAEGYRIEYDQDIPKFLNKYGKKWGSHVGKAMLDQGWAVSEDRIDEYKKFLADWNNALASARNEAEADFVREQIKHTEDDIRQMQTTGQTVWSMPITDAMKQSVLHEGQPMYSRSNIGETPKQYGKYNVYGKDVALDKGDVAPVQETEAENAVETAKTEQNVPKTENASAVLYNMRDGKNGWGDVYGTAQEALNDAVQSLDSDLWNAFNAEIDNTPQNTKLPRGSTPIINALIAVQEDVRQETITPMQGAQLLSEAYTQGGVDALNRLYNPKNGNLYQQYLDKAKQYETVAPDTEATDLFMDDLAPVEAELDTLYQQKETLESRMLEAVNAEDMDAFYNVNTEYESVMAKIEELENEISATESDRVNSLDDADVPPEMEAPYVGDSADVTVDDPFENRDWNTVGNRKVKAYMYENPEVKPFFQEEALALMGELNDTTKGERWYNDQVYYESGGEKGFGGVKRHTSASMEELLDSWGMSYADIEKGLNAIIEDNGAENIAAAKKIEFMLNDRLLHGYKDFYSNGYIQPNQDYINLLNEKQITEYSKEAFDSFMATADQYAPLPEDVTPVAEEIKATEKAPVAEKYEAIKPKPTKEPRLARATPAEQARAEILTEEPNIKKEKPSAWSKVKNLVLDKGMVFEDLSLATGNRELQARWNSIRYAEGKAQKLIGEGNSFTNSLKSMQEQVESAGKTKQFYEYLYHMHNVDRMSLAERFEDTPNKPVFGDSVTADISRDAADKLAKANPEFKQWANEIYTYNKYLRGLLVEGGVISNETAKLWEAMYPHYVPIRRMGDAGLNINVPLDTGRTGVNAPVKRAKGGNRDILPLFDTMGQRTIQTYKAIAKNRFGVELKNTLGTTIANEATSIDEAIDSIDTQDGLLQEGKNGKKPTFTVFENGEKVTFEITQEMYNAMKPTSDIFSGTSKVLNTISNVRRGTLTEYNPWFMLKNAVKDVQDVLINSQHATRTYAAIPKAIKHMVTNGHWYQEYLDNGGEQNTYFDNDTNTFNAENTALETAKTVLGLNAISKANNIIERLPRLAEYIASREAGRSIDVSMLDAARVTTNFAAGGDATKWLNRNGFTFLNASVQGAVQQARNIREAKANGLKGWASLAGKFVVAGLPAVLLNGLIWDDDEEYEELSDYVKQNYYIVGKFNNGQFVRIPKGRTVAVIQDAFEQMKNLITGDDEADLGSFVDLVVTNLAPNNPLDNNVLSPIVDVATNEAWYGGDLVPTRLQDLPTEEQYDESTDSISRWLGENFDLFDLGPYKINYLLDQYSGVIGDTFLPMLTPEAESGDNSFLGNMIAPLKDMFTTDSVMNNQNVSDFYDTVDELTTNAKSSKATDEDVLKYKYINSINAELGELYGQKREIQNSDLADDEKYEQVREIQQQIDSIAKESLATYEDVNINGIYATVGDKHYRWYEPGEDSEAEPGWQKLTDKQLKKQEDVTSGLGISASEYWSNKEEYDFAYENPEKYAVAKSVGGYSAYRNYSSELYDIKADKDENGKSINGSRKEKVLDYINNLDADYGEKIILFKSEYNADDTYNYDIIEYLNGREDISYKEMETILKELGFTVDSNGNITWD